MEKSKIIEKLFLYIVISSYLLIALFYLIINKKRSLGSIIVAVYGLLFFLILLLQDQGNLPKHLKFYIQTFYTTLEYCAFALIFWYNLETKKFKKFILVLSVLFLLFQTYYLLTQDLKLLDSIPIGIETILVFVYIAFFFYEFSKKLTGEYIYNHYCFWLAVGVLLYLGGSFFFYILINHLSIEQIKAFGYLTYVVEILKNILFIVALFVYEKNPVNLNRSKPLNIPNLDMI